MSLFPSRLKQLRISKVINGQHNFALTRQQNYYSLNFRKLLDLLRCFSKGSHRLAAQDVGLSRRKHGFDSRWDHQ